MMESDGLVSEFRGSNFGAWCAINSSFSAELVAMLDFDFAQKGAKHAGKLHISHKSFVDTGVLLDQYDSLLLAILEDSAHFEKNIVVHRIILSWETAHRHIAIVCLQKQRS